MRRPAMRYLVAGWMTFSLRPAKATETLTVEQGWKPVESATFWFTMVRTRPVFGSTTTTEPLYCPSDSTAARRMSRSSPSMLSPSVESAYVGLVHGPPAIIAGVGAGTASRGPATAAFCACTAITRTGARGATDTAGLTSLFTGAFTGCLAAAVACAGLPRRCLCLRGPAAAKPVAARRWRDTVKAMIRDAMAKNDLFIRMHQIGRAHV